MDFRWISGLTVVGLGGVAFVPPGPAKRRNPWLVLLGLPSWEIDILKRIEWARDRYSRLIVADGISVRC